MTNPELFADSSSIFSAISISIAGIVFITTLVYYQCVVLGQGFNVYRYWKIRAMWFYAFFYANFIIFYLLIIIHSFNKAPFEFISSGIELRLDLNIFIIILFKSQILLYVFAILNFLNLIKNKHKSDEMKKLISEENGNCACPAIDSNCPLK
jgi:hypothetical protein